MGILHIRITEANQVIKLDSGIHSQNMTLKKVVIIKNKDQTVPTLPAVLYNYKGGVTVNLSFLGGGIEVASNVNSDELSFPFKQEEDVTELDYNLNFDAEDIDSNFAVSVFNYDKSSPTTQPSQPTFDTTGLTDNALMYIDLYFDYSSLFDYNKY
jgi:hypothetical protein